MSCRLDLVEQQDSRGQTPTVLLESDAQFTAQQDVFHIARIIWLHISAGILEMAFI